MRRTLAAMFALAVAFASPPLRAQSPAGVPVLMYHKVDAPPPSDAVGRSLTLEPAAFEAQVRWLHDRKIETLTTQGLVDAVSGAGTPQHAVVLTFDDGYEDAYLKVFPILRKYGEHASFYVSADLVGSPRHLSWKELREMQAAGMEIGCHGSRHLDLTTLDLAGKNGEIGHCAAALKRWLGTAPRTYAYAAGRYDAAAIGVVRANGFDAALTENNGLVSTTANAFEWPRRRVDRDTSPSAYAAIATP